MTKMLTFRAVIPAHALLDPAKLTLAIENGLDEAAVGIQSEFERTTMTWEHKPKFTIDTHPGSRTVYTSDRIYGYVSDGTDMHYIRAKNKKALHFFRTGFRAKSRVNKLVANKGAKASKDETYIKGVWHPGTEARNFDDSVKKKWDTKFRMQMQRAIDSEFTSA